MMSPSTPARRAVVASIVATLLAGTAACTSGDDSSPPASNSGASTQPSVAPSLAQSSGAGSSSRSTVGSTTPIRTTTAPNSPQPSQVTRTPVPLSATASFGGAVTGSITGVRSLQAKAIAPGEVSGPGLAVSIRIVNGSGKRLDLDNAVVDLAYGADNAPGGPMSGPPSAPLPVSLAAGKSARGTFVFRVDSAVRAGTRLVVSVSYSPTAPRVLFAGTR